MKELNDLFIHPRHRAPKYSIVAHITGVQMPDEKIHWIVDIDGAEDNEEAAGILERAAEVLRDK